MLQMPARRTRTSAQPGRRRGKWLADGGEGVVFCDEGEHVSLLLTKKFQIGNWKFQISNKGNGKSVRRKAWQLSDAFDESESPRRAGAYESGGKPPHSKDSLACCDDCCGEGGFFVGEDGAQVED